MATAEVLDFNTLLTPIAGDNPAGTDARSDPSPISDYYTIRDARKAASDAERRIDQGDLDTPTPDWKQVRDRAVKVLATKTKDLEFGAYLVESLTRLHGFAGIRDGYRLAREFLELFWDHIYPVPEDSDVEGRFSHVLWLNGLDRPGTLVVPIAKIPITAESGSGEFALTHYHEGLKTARISDAKVRQKKIDEGAMTLEVIQRAVASSPPKFYGDLVDDINQSLEEYNRFCTVLAEKSGYEVSSSDLISAIQSVLDVVKDIAKDKIPKTQPAAAPAAAKEEPVAVADAQGTGAGVVASAPPGAILTREDALLNLEKLAEYFRKNEPHSILPFALEQVVAWGRMSLPDLLAELIPDDGSRKNLFKQVGIRAEGSGDKK